MGSAAPPGPPGEDACGLCGGLAGFTIEDGLSLREARCARCGASRRNSDVALAIVSLFAPGVRGGLSGALSRLRPLSIFEAQGSGPLHEALKQLPRYACAEYFDGVPTGLAGPGGIRCENLERLNFAGESFDLVVTQDVLEHVRDPDTAYAEVSRVLRRGGSHVFTVPVHEGHPTVARVRRRGGRDVLLEPPVHHADPLREAGSLVCTDFGDDLAALLERLGIPAAVAVRRAFYPPERIPWIHGEEAYADYARRTWGASIDALLRYFHYNSIVFRAGKGAPPHRSC